MQSLEGTSVPYSGPQRASVCSFCSGAPQRQQFRFPKINCFSFQLQRISFLSPSVNLMLSCSFQANVPKLLTPTSLSRSHTNCPSFFLHSSFCNSLHPPLPLSHGTLPPYHFLSLHFINELAKQISIDTDGCLSFLKAEFKVQSECVCAHMRMTSNEKQRKKAKA